MTFMPPSTQLTLLPSEAVGCGCEHVSFLRLVHTVKLRNRQGAKKGNPEESIRCLTQKNGSDYIEPHPLSKYLAAIRKCNP